MLALVFVLGVFLWWWYRPVPINEPWGLGYGLTYQARVRRTWKGDRVYVGPATIRYENGNVAMLGDVNGMEENTVAFGINKDHCKYWHEDGRPLNQTEWFLYLSAEYVPRHMNGEPSQTEEEWRAAAAKFRKEHPEFSSTNTADDKLAH
jgi:hypothetical protein